MTESDARRLCNSLSILGNYEMYLLTRRDTGMEEGLAFFSKDKQCVPRLDELILEQLGEKDENVQGAEDIFKAENAPNNDKEFADVINTLSSPSILPSILKLPPTLSITPCPITSTTCSFRRSPSLQYTTPSMTHTYVSGALLALTQDKSVHDKNSNQIEMVTIKGVSKYVLNATGVKGQVSIKEVSKNNRKRSLCNLCNRFFTPKYLRKHQETIHGQENQDTIETVEDTTKKSDKDSSISNNGSGNTTEYRISSDEVDNLPATQEKDENDIALDNSKTNNTEHLPSSVSGVEEFVTSPDTNSDKMVTRSTKMIQGQKEKRKRVDHSNTQTQKKRKELSEVKDVIEMEKPSNNSSKNWEGTEVQTYEPADANTMDCDKSFVNNISDMTHKTPMKIHVEDSKFDFQGVQREGEGSPSVKVSDNNDPGGNLDASLVVSENLDSSMTRRSKRLMQMKKKVLDANEPPLKKVSPNRRAITTKHSLTTEERSSSSNNVMSGLSNEGDGTTVKLVFKEYDSDSQRETADIVKVSESNSSNRTPASPSVKGGPKVNGNLYEKSPLYQDNMQGVIVTAHKRTETKEDELNMKISNKKPNIDKITSQSRQKTEGTELSAIQRMRIDVYETCSELADRKSDDNDDYKVIKKGTISSVEGIVSTVSSPASSCTSSRCSGGEPKSPEPVPPVCPVSSSRQPFTRPLPHVTEPHNSVGIKTEAPILSSPRPSTSPARISFTVEAQGSLIPKGKSRLMFNFSMKPNAPLIKGLLAFQEKLKAADLEFVCEGRVLTGAELGQEVKGKTVFVRTKESVMGC